MDDELKAAAERYRKAKDDLKRHDESAAKIEREHLANAPRRLRLADEYCKAHDALLACAGEYRAEP